MAVGDEVNDLEMLRAAGIGVAMGDSPADVKKAADQVTSGSVQSGVVETFLRNGLTAPQPSTKSSRQHSAGTSGPRRTKI